MDSLATLVTLIVFLLFAFSLYHVLGSSLNTFKQFDLIFTSTIFFLLTARILAIILHLDNFKSGFSFNPLGEENGNIVLFQSWPWVLFRFWDGYFNFYPFIMEGVIASLLAIRVCAWKKIYRRAKIFETFIAILFITFALLIFLQNIFKLTLSGHNESISGYGYLYIFPILILTSIASGYLFKKYKFTDSIFIFALTVWGLLSIILRLSLSIYEPLIGNVDIFYLEGIFNFTLPILYTIFRILRLRFKRNEIPTKFSRNMNDRKVDRIDYKEFSKNSFAPSFWKRKIGRNKS